MAISLGIYPIFPRSKTSQKTPHFSAPGAGRIKPCPQVFQQNGLWSSALSHVGHVALPWFYDGGNDPNHGNHSLNCSGLTTKPNLQFCHLANRPQFMGHPIIYRLYPNKSPCLSYIYIYTHYVYIYIIYIYTYIHYVDVYIYIHTLCIYIYTQYIYIYLCIHVSSFTIIYQNCNIRLQTIICYIFDASTHLFLPMILVSSARNWATGDRTAKHLVLSVRERWVDDRQQTAVDQLCEFHLKLLNCGIDPTDTTDEQTVEDWTKSLDLAQSSGTALQRTKPCSCDLWRTKHWFRMVETLRFLGWYISYRIWSRELHTSIFCFQLYIYIYTHLYTHKISFPSCVLKTVSPRHFFRNQQSAWHFVAMPKFQAAQVSVKVMCENAGQLRH